MSKMTLEEATELLANSTRGSIGEYMDAEEKVYDAGHTHCVSVEQHRWVERSLRMRATIDALQRHVKVLDKRITDKLRHDCFKPDGAGSTTGVTLFEYEQSVLSTVIPAATSYELLTAALGVSKASGALSDAVKRLTLAQGELSRNQLEDELGSLLWYITLAAKAVGTNLTAVAKKNLETACKFAEENTNG